MKKYKSSEELLDYIVLNGVIVNNRQDAIDKFQRYTYYSIINTYKEVFKKDNKYITGVTFDEIYSLYEFDKNLRIIFLKYVLEIETIIKSLIANMISQKYGIKKYLDERNCFDSNADIELIQKLISNINEMISKNYEKHQAVTHYIKNYDFVPPFVLVKIMTLGQISRYYGLLKQTDRQAVSKYFKISDKILKQILVNLTLVRNICAHNDRLYTFHSKFLISPSLTNRTLRIEGKSTNLYMLLNSMKYLLDAKNYHDFVNQINNEINILSQKINCININDILKIMGFLSE